MINRCRKGWLSPHSSQFAALFRHGEKYAREEKGVAAIEFALILPVMLILFIGMIELTMRLSESRKTTLMSGLIGDLVAQSDTGVISESELQDYYAAARYVLLPFDNSRVLVRVASFKQDSNNGNIIRDWQITQGGLDQTKCPEVQVSDLPSEMQTIIRGGTTIIMARVCRQQKTLFSSFFGVTLEKSPIYRRDSFFRPRYVNSISCPTCTS